ncbi:MAG: RidA family protein [Acidimicrobiia bacterium]
MKQAITPESFPWFDYEGFTFSLGLDLGDRALLSGHTGAAYNPDVGKMAIDGPMTDQATTAYEKVTAILEGAGMSWDDVVCVTEYVTVAGLPSYAEAEAVRATFCGSTTPAVQTIVLESLVRRNAFLEIEVTASKHGQAFGIGSNGRAAYAEATQADGVVHLSTIHPYDEQGNLVGAGDIEAQTRQIFRNADRVLGDLGLTMANVTKTVEMISLSAVGSYKSTGRVRKEFLGPVYPGAAGIVQRQVATDPEVLISYDFTASQYLPKAINPGWDRYENLAYSPAVIAGNVVFMSGQAALDPETERAVHAGDVVEQTRYTYKNILTVLEAADLGPEALVKTVEYVTPEGLAGYRNTAEVRRELLAEPWPASTGAYCHSLLRPEFEIEIDPTAMLIEEES